MRVAVVDSGIDADHPEFAGRIAASQSFVGGGIADKQGHGTFVAGVIAAAADNGEGIAGIAFPAELLVAKVVRSDGTISPEAEAKAIRWAADNGARVINLSLGGLRDPIHRDRDTFSDVEARAVSYAYSKGAVLVAAVGNGDEAPKSPWPYASYPAALPHVLGVSALAADGSVPAFSNRDKVYNDIAAPGVGIVSTLPRALTASRPTCLDQGYSLCGPPEFRNADGTSYAAAEVSAAAALLIAAHPSLAPSQVTALLERSAVDVNAATGCTRCDLRRDQLSGWGRLDVAGALKVAGRPAAAARPLRGERPGGRPGVRAVRPLDRHQGDARLLGRQRRRLQDAPHAGPDGLGLGRGAARHGHEPDALAAGHADRRDAVARRADRDPVAARDAVRAGRAERALPASRDRSRGGTTSR